MKVTIPSRIHDPANGERSVLLPAVEVENVDTLTIESGGVTWTISLPRVSHVPLRDGRIVVDTPDGLSIFPISNRQMLLEPRGSFGEYVLPCPRADDKVAAAKAEARLPVAGERWRQKDEPDASSWRVTVVVHKSKEGPSVSLSGPGPCRGHQKVGLDEFIEKWEPAT